GRRFEAGHPLGRVRPPSRWSGREARQRPAKPFTRVQIPSPPRLVVSHIHHSSSQPARAIGAAVARFLDTEEVTGSNPVSPTIGKRPLTCGNASRGPLIFPGRAIHVRSLKSHFGGRNVPGTRQMATRRRVRAVRFLPAFGLGGGE